MQPVPTAPTAAEDGGLSTHVLHMTRLHAKRPFLVELRVINGPFEGGCRLQSGGGAWLACNTSAIGAVVAATAPALPATLPANTSLNYMQPNFELRRSATHSHQVQRCTGRRSRQPAPLPLPRVKTRSMLCMWLQQKVSLLEPRGPT